MRNRNLFVSILMACLLTAGFAGIAPVAKAAPIGPSLQNPGAIAGSNLIEVKRRGHGVKIHLPKGPAYIYQDYPYYYSRGYYPTHIGGYVYYPSSSRAYTSKYSGQCAKWHRKCAANWGKGNEDYYGCMNYHRCD